jgi:hypothetical protein
MRAFCRVSSGALGERFPKGGLVIVPDSMVAGAATEPEPRGFLLAGVYALVGTVGLLTLVGAFVALATLNGGSSAHEHPAGQTALQTAPSNDIGRSIPTSFGVIAVESVKKLTGLTPKQLGGMTHFPSWVKPDQMQVQVFLEISNLKNHTIRYSPRQFRLVAGNGSRIPILSTTFPGGILQPSASIDGQVTFIAPRRTRAGAHLWLEFREPGRTAPVRFDLGSARTRGRIPTVTDHEQDHLHQRHPPP